MASAYETAWGLLARHGRMSVPVEVHRADGKKRVRPRVPFPHLWNEAPAAEILEQTWAGNEDSNGIAMLLDERAGLLAVDTDSPEATSWAIEQFRRCRTPWFQSARGRKWLFRLPAFEVRSSASKLHSAVDVRAPNSALVIPPTPGYRWVPTYSLEDIPIAPCPEHLRKMLSDLVPKRPAIPAKTRPVAAPSLYAAAALELEAVRVC